jgi:hypothetical protein
VALSKSTGGRAGIGKFVSVGVGPEELDGNGAKVVKDVDLWGVGHFMFGQNSGPEAEPSVMAEFNVIKSKGGSLAKKIGPVGGAVGMPAGGEGEGGSRHRRVVSLKKRVGRRDFSGGWGVLKVGGETGKIIGCWRREFLIVEKSKGWGFVTAYDKLRRDIQCLGMSQINPMER